MNDDIFFRSINLQTWNREQKDKETMLYPYKIIQTATVNVLKIRLIDNKIITLISNDIMGDPWKDFYTWYMEKESPTYVFNYGKPLRVYRRDVLFCNHYTKTKKIK